MRKILAVVLIPFLAAPAMAGAQQLPDQRLHNAGRLLGAALEETRKLSRALDGAPAVPGGAQIAANSPIWIQVLRLAPGAVLRLTLRDGTELEGELVEARVDSLVLRNNRLLKGQLRTPDTTTLLDAQTFQQSSLSAITIVDRNEPPSMDAKIVAVAVGYGFIVWLLMSSVAWD